MQVSIQQGLERRFGGVALADCGGGAVKAPSQSRLLSTLFARSTRYSWLSKQVPNECARREQECRRLDVYGTTIKGIK